MKAFFNPRKAAHFVEAAEAGKPLPSRPSKQPEADQADDGDDAPCNNSQSQSTLKMGGGSTPSDADDDAGRAVS